jgi:hypothetical protein
MADVNTGTLGYVPTQCVEYVQGLTGWTYAQNGKEWVCSLPKSLTSQGGNDAGCVYFDGGLQVDNWSSNCPKLPPTSTSAWQQDISSVQGQQQAQAQAQIQEQEQAQADQQHQQWLNWCGGLASTLQGRESHVSDAQAHLADAQQHLADMQAHPEYGQGVVDDAKQQVADAKQQLAQAQQWVDDTANDLANGGCPQAPTSFNSESPDNTTIVTTTGGTSAQAHQTLAEFLQWRASLGHNGWHPAGSMSGFTQTCTDQKGDATLTVYDLDGTPKSPDLCKW